MAARVVLADDHPLFLQALQVAMERAGFEVVGTATRGDDLLELMDRVQADVVLLDLAMPGYDGFECIHRLRASHPDAAIVVVSGADDEASIRHAMEAGAVCFVGKAADPNDLAGAIHVLLNDAIHLTPHTPPIAPEPAREPGRGGRGCSADPAGARDSATRLQWAFERPDGKAPVGDRADDQVPPLEHLSQDRDPEPHRGEPLGAGERAARRRERGVDRLAEKLRYERRIPPTDS